ncbi:Do family serine endopeptidase [Psychromonas aquatilis]|uniref:Do family serine endopeptidase n=1 Tax=Psychromonas aquatilis TaxID=2005072 RepID=A0ABU9GN36_9GAMM
MSIFKHYFFCTLLLLVSSNSIGALPNAVNNNPLPSLAPLIKKVSPAVVDIAITSNLNQLQLGPRQQILAGLGSGVIIDAEHGYIITNYHVIENASEIIVKLISGHQFEATVVGQDIQSDIALLKIESTQPLVAIAFSDSDKLQVGDFTIAIGNPFGLGQTVTSGIVSALGRSGLNLQNLENYIQTDAAINSGNSGGALLNLKGELIGINTAILGPAGGNIGIAFAIPSNMVKNLTQQLLTFGKVHRGILGVKGGEVTPELAKSFSLDVQHGAFIYEVTPGSGADKAGLKAGDVITAINGTSIKSFAALRAKIGTLSAGKKITLNVLQNNKSKVISVVLGGTRPIPIQSKINPEVIFKGATLKDSGPNQKIPGVKVVTTEENSEASRLGLIEGDIIVAVNKIPVKNQLQLSDALKKAKNMQALNIVRDHRRMYIIVK